MSHPRLALPIALALLLAGCLDGAPGPLPDASTPPPDAAGEPAPFEVRGATVRDLTGRLWVPERIPQRPVLTVDLSHPLAEPWEDGPESVVLLVGPPSEDLLDDLDREPLRRATEARLVGAVLRREGTRVIVEPTGRLEPGRPYTLALGAWARDGRGRRIEGPWALGLEVAPGTEGGTRVLSSWPADGSAGVPSHLPMAAVRFDGEADGLPHGVHLLGPAGAAVPARTQTVLCELVGWPDGRCVTVRPDLILAADVEYRLEVSAAVVDPTGAPVGPFAARFRTSAAAGDEPPRFVSHPCALDEEASEAGCLLRDDRSLTLRVRADRPVRLWLTSDAAGRSAVASRGDATLRLEGLSPDTEHRLTLRATDLAGLETLAHLDTRTHPPLAPVAISEVRADPRGPEPAQEYVELANLGTDPVDLGGFTLADRPDREGDAFPEGTVLAAGARALVVADGFDPSSADDDRVPPGVALIRVGTSLGSGGLTNAGEPLFLRDTEGRRVSAAPAMAAPDAGACIVRAVDDPRRGDDGAFAPDARGGCTPGRADRLP